MHLQTQTSNFINATFENYIDPSEGNDTKRMHPSADEFSNVLDVLFIEKKNIHQIRVEETKNQIAVPPHTDLPKGFETIIVPLKFEGSVSTILFDSFYLGNNIKGYKYRPTNTRYYEGEWLSEDVDKITNISNKSFDHNHYKKYLSYMSIDDLHGLTIQKTYDWTVNKVIKFPSHQLHSGSSFKNSKRWLLVSHAIS